MHEGEKQKKAMSKLNHQSPAQWVLCPLLSNPKCVPFAQWPLRKPCNNVKEQNLSLKTEACLRLLSRALGLWIPPVQAGSLCWAMVSPAAPLGHHMGCGHPCPYNPHAPLRVQLTGTLALGFCSALHPRPWHSMVMLSPLGYLSQKELENLFTRVRFRGRLGRPAQYLQALSGLGLSVVISIAKEEPASWLHRDVQRGLSSPAEVFHLSAFILSPSQDFQRKPWAPALVINGKRQRLLQRDLAYLRLGWIWAELLPKILEPWFPLAFAPSNWQGACSRDHRPQGNWPLPNELEESERFCDGIFSASQPFPKKLQAIHVESFVCEQSMKKYVIGYVLICFYLQLLSWNAAFFGKLMAIQTYKYDVARGSEEFNCLSLPLWLVAVTPIKYCDSLFSICLLLPSPISICGLIDFWKWEMLIINKKRDIRKKVD